MDGITLDALLAEVRTAVLGRHVRRVRLGAAAALVLEVAGERDQRLWLDARRGTAGCYLLRREVLSAVEEREELTGRALHALLHLRKHLEGARVAELARVPGERTVVLKMAADVASLVLRLSGPAPALTLAVAGRALASLGEGPEAWPPPAPADAREWHALDADAFARAVEEGRSHGRSLARAILAACPPLGPDLAALLDGTAEGFAALRQRLRSPRPTLVVAHPLDACRDRDLAEANAVLLLPLHEPGLPGIALQQASWVEATALALQLRTRGMRFGRRRQTATQETARRAARLARLEANLSRDLNGLPRADVLRRQAEALLASPSLTAGPDGLLDVPDPRDPSLHHHIPAERGTSPAALADRLFHRARRLESARRQVTDRLGSTQRALEDARRLEAAVHAARDLAEIPPLEGPPRTASSRDVDETEAGPRRYLTSRGLELLVGRSARENQRLSFELARPDDIWCHALDVPGAHVVVRDREGRANAEDEREAAEVAAFFSGAQQEAKVDVHVTRRKFVQAVRGAPGRVRIVHSEVRRVAPKNPEGRLRRR